MKDSIHIDEALRIIWSGSEPIRLEYFKKSGERGMKNLCIHPTNHNKHFQKKESTNENTDKRSNPHLKGQHLIKMMDLTNGQIFLLHIPLLTKINGQKIRHQRAI
jgi:hypothetical protein